MSLLHKISRGSIAAFIAVVLVGCSDTGGGDGNTGGGFSGFLGMKAPRTTRLAGLQILAEGPAGFCIERSTKTSTSNSGFVVLGACAAISGNPSDVMPPIRAVLTASVSQVADMALMTPDQLADFIQSTAGRASLAQSGSASHIKVLTTKTVDDVFMVQVRDTSPNRANVLSDKYWRAMFLRKGHLVSLTVSALHTHPFSDRTGQRLLSEFIAQMQHVNPQSQVAEVAGEADETGPATGFWDALGNVFGQGAN